MLILNLLSWWYTKGWLQQFKSMGSSVSKWVEYFSFGIILKTLFSPWRQMVVRPGAEQPLNTKTSAFVDNTVSRFVGLGVRLIVMTAGVITIIAVVIGYLVFVLIWPLIPLSPIVLTVAGAML